MRLRPSCRTTLAARGQGHRSRHNAKINRNFEVFTPTDFLAANHPAYSRQRRPIDPLLWLVLQQNARRPPPWPAPRVGDSPPPSFLRRRRPNCPPNSSYLSIKPIMTSAGCFRSWHRKRSECVRAGANLRDAHSRTGLLSCIKDLAVHTTALDRDRLSTGFYYAK